MAGEGEKGVCGETGIMKRCENFSKVRNLRKHYNCLKKKIIITDGIKATLSFTVSIIDPR